MTEMTKNDFIDFSPENAEEVPHSELPFPLPSGCSALPPGY